MTTLAVFHWFEQLAVIANLAALLLYGAVAVATLVLRRRDVRHDGATPFRVPGGALVPLLTVALIAWLLTSITPTEWAALVATLAVASIFTRSGRASPRTAHHHSGPFTITQCTSLLAQRSS